MASDSRDVPSRVADPKLGMKAGDQLVLRGPRMDFVLRTLPTRSGRTIQREVVVHPGAVLILPVAADGRIVLIRNFRHTVQTELWELPAGTLEKGEDPAVCAGRELLEETGYEAGRIESLGWFFTSPGVLTEKMYAFLATNLTQREQSLEENEQIQVELLPLEQVLKMIQENVVVDAKTIATVLKYYWRQGEAGHGRSAGEQES